MFECIKSDFEYIERPANECLTEQQRLSRPVNLPEIRSQFWQDYLNNGFSYLIDNYTNNSN